MADFEINDLKEWPNVKTVIFVLTINYDTIPIFDKINNPKVIGYTETTNHFYVVEMLKRLSKVFKQFVFAHTEASMSPAKNLKLLVSFKSGQTFYFPKNLELVDSELSTFLINITTQSIPPTFTFGRQDLGDIVSNMLRHTKLVRQRDFNETIDTHKEILLLLVDTRYAGDAHKVAEVFDKIAVAYKSSPHVLIRYYDLLIDNSLPIFKNKIPPSVFYFHDDYSDVLEKELDGERLLKFLDKNTLHKEDAKKLDL